MVGDVFLIKEKCKEFGLDLIDENFDYDRSRDKTFKVRCTKCGGVLNKSYVTLVKHNCGCSLCSKKRKRDYHNSIDDVMPKIQKECQESGFEFLGFVGGEWKKCRTTKLLLKCIRCGKITEKNYDNFINKHAKCICNRVEKLTLANKLKDYDVFYKINKTCEKNDFSFVRFLSKDGKYHNNKTKLEVKCKICGETSIYDFNHFTDRKNTCCLNCTKSLLEKRTKQKLKKDKIKFIEQKKFDWLVNHNKMSLDFYLPEHNIAIECQGIQHFEPIGFFGGEKAFKEQTKRDKKKYELCKQHGINLKYIITEEDINNFDYGEENR